MMENLSIPPLSSWQVFLEQQRREEYPLLKSQLAALEKLFSSSEPSTADFTRQIAKPSLDKLQQDPDLPIDEFRLWRTIDAVVRQLTNFNDRLAERLIEYQKVCTAGLFNAEMNRLSISQD